MNNFFIHVGAHKTGSTYFQQFCARNRLQLLLDGIYYVVGSVQDGNNEGYGNGRVLYEGLLAGNPVKPSIRTQGLAKTIRDYGGVSGQDVLISDEDLLFVDEVGWADVKSICSELGYKIRIIFFIREPVSYYESLYSHCVRSYCEVRSPETFVMEESWGHINSLLRFGDIFSDDELVVKPYQGNILDQMAEVLSRDLRGDSYISDCSPVNVKMSAEVIEMALRANRAGLGCMVPDMVDYISRQFHGSSSELRFSGKQEIVSEIRSKHAGHIDYLNDRFFCKNRLEWPIANMEDEGEGAECHGSAAYAGYDFFLLKMSEFEKGYHNLVVSSIKARLVALKSANAGDLPRDFSPIEYLLLNTDVLFAGADPGEHFLSFGEQEGRRYKL